MVRVGDVEGFDDDEGDVRDGVDEFVEVRVDDDAGDDDAGDDERRAGGPSRSDDLPGGNGKGRARGGRGVAGRTAGCRVGARCASFCDGVRRTGCILRAIDDGAVASPSRPRPRA